jgi:hypothetical protein
MQKNYKNLNHQFMNPNLDLHEKRPKKREAKEIREDPETRLAPFTVAEHTSRHCQL